MFRVLVLIVSFSSLSFAHERVEFGEPKGEGSCVVEGSLSDGRLSLDLNEYEAQLQDTAQDRKTCLIAIPMGWPKGQRIVIEDLHVRGSYSLSERTKATVRAEMFTAGGKGEVLELGLRPGEGRYRETLDGVAHRSDCEGSGILRLNSSVTVRANRGRIQSSSTKVKKINARISVERCE